MHIKKRLMDGLRWAGSRLTERSAILLYHRVAENGRDPFGLCVTPANFGQQMAAISELGRALRLDDLLEKHQRGTLPPGSISVTFDDAYVDVLQNAVPVLERFEIPATIFVVTGNLGKPFWWDRLADLIIYPGDLPASLEFGTPHAPMKFHTRGVSRRHLLKRVYPIVRRMAPAERDEQLAALALAIGHGPEADGPRAMTAAELQSLSEHPLITLGAHTVTHPQLSGLGRDGQRQEIASSLQQLGSITGLPVTTFSYPFGLRSRDYTPETIAAAKDAGLSSAIAADLNVVTSRADLLAMPRLWVHDWDGTGFRRNIGRWL